MSGWEEEERISIGGTGKDVERRTKRGDEDGTGVGAAMPFGGFALFWDLHFLWVRGIRFSRFVVLIDGRKLGRSELDRDVTWEWRKSAGFGGITRRD